MVALRELPGDRRDLVLRLAGQMKGVKEAKEGGGTPGVRLINNLCGRIAL